MPSRRQGQWLVLLRAVLVVVAAVTVEAHGGRLEVSSVPREGATFVLTLPAAGE